MALQRRTRAIGNNRRMVGGAGLDDGRNLFGTTGEGHALGQGGGMIGLARAMMFAHRLGGGKTLAQQIFQRGDKGVR